MPDVHSLQVGFSWAAIIGAIGTIFGLVIKSIGPWRKQLTEAEERLRSELTAALATERATHAAELRAHALERDEMGDRIAKLEQLLQRRDRLREAERAIERHRFANLDQCFQSFLMLVKANPDKVGEAIIMVEKMRANQLLAEAEEKAIIHAAEIAADEGIGHDA